MNINKNSVLYTSTILALSNIFLQILGFVYRIFLTDMAGTEALGVYKLVMQLYFVILAITTSGCNLVSANKSAELFGLGEIPKLKRTIKACLILFFILLFSCSIVIIVLDDFIAEKVLGDFRTKNAIYIVIFCIFLTGIENIIKNSLIGIKKVKYTAISEIIEQILRVVIVLSLLFFFADGDYAKIAFLIIFGMTLSEIFSIVFLTFVYKKIYKTSKTTSDKVFASVVKVAIPISIASIFTNIISSASTLVLPERLILAGFSRDEALSSLGVVSGIAIPILILPIAIIGSFCMILMPNISKSRALGDSQNIIRKINKSFEATGLIGIPATAFLIYLANPIGRLFFKTEFEYLYIFILGYGMLILYYQITTSNILYGLGKEKKTVIHSIIGESFQFAITFLLCSIPTINIYGYILGIALSPTIVTLLNCTYIFNKYKFNFIKFLVNPLLLGIFVYASVKVSYELLLNVFENEYSVLICSFVIVGMLYALILRLFGINYIQYIRNLHSFENFQLKLK